MVEKKIKKFYNSVPVQERMWEWADDTKHNTVPLAWIAASLVAVIGVFIIISAVLKEEFSDSDSD